MDSDEVTRSIAYINSLPSVDALPEVESRNSNVIEATDVIPVLGEALGASLGEVLGLVPGEELDVESPAPLVDVESPAQYQRASLISVRVFKTTRGTKLGIALISVNGILQISKPPTNLLADSSLQVGDEVVSLNGISCASWTSNQAADHLVGIIGLVSIVVEDPNGDPNQKEAIVFKDRPQDELGIAFQNDTDGRLRIEKIFPRGLLGSDCPLRTDDHVISINAIPCCEINSDLARSMVIESPGKVTIVASTMHHETAISNGSVIEGVSSGQEANAPHATMAEVITDEEWGTATDETNANPAFISVMLFKSSRQTRLGIRLINTDGILQVSSILSDGILASSPLKEGFIILSINSRQCKGWEVSRALNVLKEAQGKLNIVTQNPNGDPNYVEAMVMKSSAQSKIGATFTKTQVGKLRLSFIDPNGMLAESVLNIGDYVMAINSVPCQYLQANDATRLVRQALNTVTILTKTQRSTGVVVSMTSERHGTENVRPTEFLPEPLVSVSEAEHRKADAQRKLALCILFIAAVIFLVIFVSAS
jgi:C-terminal processing protease CtpA/Prc